MTDPNRPKPAETEDAANGESADRAGASGGESTRPDPDALDQSVGREDAGQGDARTRNGAF